MNNDQTNKEVNFDDMPDGLLTEREMRQALAHVEQGRWFFEKLFGVPAPTHEAAVIMAKFLMDFDQRLNG
jgi:hypothetical protein